MGSGWINGIGVLGDYPLKNGGLCLARFVFYFVSVKKRGAFFTGLPGTEGEEMFTVLGGLGI